MTIAEMNQIAEELRTIASRRDRSEMTDLREAAERLKNAAQAYIDDCYEVFFDF